MAANTGVDVNIMIPCKPDHPFVYWSTFSNVAELLEYGVKVYTYQNGFIHSKMLMIDDEVSSVGSSNMDYRSFVLNFEVNAFVYDEQLAKKLKEAYKEDIKKSKQLTLEKYKNDLYQLNSKKILPNYYHQSCKIIKPTKLCALSVL